MEGRLRRGWWVLLGLALGTFAEVAVSLWVPRSTGYQLILALIDAGLILWFFMHVRQLRSPEEEI